MKKALSILGTICVLASVIFMINPSHAQPATGSDGKFDQAVGLLNANQPKEAWAVLAVQKNMEFSGNGLNGMALPPLNNIAAVVSGIILVDGRQRHRPTLSKMMLAQGIRRFPLLLQDVID